MPIAIPGERIDTRSFQGERSDTCSSPRSSPAQGTAVWSCDHAEELPFCQAPTTNSLFLLCFPEIRLLPVQVSDGTWQQTASVGMAVPLHQG